MSTQKTHGTKKPFGMMVRLLGALVRPWLDVRLEPSTVDDAFLLPDIPVLYVIDSYGLANITALQEAVRRTGLPAPLQPMTHNDPSKKGRAVAALSRRQSFFGGSHGRSRSETLTHIIESAMTDDALRIQVVPVSIFIGRAPDRDKGWFSVLFSENWGVMGRFKRAMAVLINGRNTIVHFGQPAMLRDYLVEGENVERNTRRISRLLRSHFRTVRSAIIGADLSHRRTMVEGLLNTESIRQAITQTAEKEGTSVEASRQKARDMIYEVAADYSHPVIRSLSFIFRPFWNKVYRGIRVHHMDASKKATAGHEVIYVPCHRSHTDYLLMSYQLYENNMVPPHIAAGINLNLPVIGPILRRAGAFFLRRSFRANALYSAVFAEYMASLISRGVAIEYFIEGGRSRTGRSLPPKNGLLAMTVRGYLRQPERPVVFQPIYIGYEKLMEGDAYWSELSGQAKKKETFIGLVRAAASILRKRYGRVVVNFGEPIYLNDLMQDHAAEVNIQKDEVADRPSWLNPMVSDLANRIMTRINAAADLNPINLLALALLSTPKAAMDESDLIRAINLFKHLAEHITYSQHVSITPMNAEEIIQYGEDMNILQRSKHPLGDILSMDEHTAVLQSYFRNNVIHLFTASAWVACCFLNNRKLRVDLIKKLGHIMYPVLRAEWFLPWDDEGFAERIDDAIDVLAEQGLLSVDDSRTHVSRGPGQTDEVFLLRVLANSLIQSFQRHYTAVATLVNHGSGVLSSKELEQRCKQTTERFSRLYTQQAVPEFFDRALFREFLGKLREVGLVWLDDNTKLAFDDRLITLGEHSKTILSREHRHSILKASPDVTLDA